jgi:hypothetical protein
MEDKKCETCIDSGKLHKNDRLRCLEPMAMGLAFCKYDKRITGETDLPDCWESKAEAERFLNENTKD